MGNCIRAQSTSEQQDNTRQNKNTRVNSSKRTSNDVIEENGRQGERQQVRYLVRHGTNATEEDEVNINEEQQDTQWNFPPTLEEFNLMDSDVDPSMLEEMFQDKRLIQVTVCLSKCQGLGLTIVGGKGSATGDVPVYIKRILPDSVLHSDAKIKTGDELIAVNDIILVNATKEYATEALSSVQGAVRLLLLQDL